MCVSAKTDRSARTVFDCAEGLASVLTNAPSARRGRRRRRPPAGPVRVLLPAPEPAGVSPGPTSRPLCKRPCDRSGSGSRPLPPFPPPLRIAGRASPLTTGRQKDTRVSGGVRSIGAGNGQVVEIAGVGGGKRERSAGLPLPSGEGSRVRVHERNAFVRDAGSGG